MIKWIVQLPLCLPGWAFILCIGLLAPLASFGQVFSSRDNHTNLWQNRSAWTQNWAGIAAPTNITDAEPHIYGYLAYGTVRDSSDISFTGTTAKLVVEDTLRIHGNLYLFNGASLHIKPGGILIVDGYYQQDADANFTNEGNAIFLGDWNALGNTGSFSNTGNLYVNGTVAEGGNNTLYKTFSDLANENYLLYYFTYVRVIRAVCTGSNHDTLTFRGDYQRVIHWESSGSFFGSDTTIINNQTDTLTYTNLTQTTSYRVYYETKPPMPQQRYSSGATIVVLENTLGGSLSGPAEVCAGTNTGTLSLSNFLGEVIRWEGSTDDFSTEVTVVASGGESFTFTDISSRTSYRAVVRNGDCNEAYSAVHTIQVSPLSEGGMLAGSTEECADVNSGELSLSGYTGDILSWESSTDNFATITTIANTSALLSYENLSQTTAYRAVVKSGVCSQVYSPVATITVSSIAGGTLSGEQAVCAGENTGELLLSSWQGNILRWESSTDGFATLTPIAHTTEAYTFQNLTATTSFRAVVGNAVCGETYSSAVEIIVNQPAVGGDLTPGDTAVCAGINEGILSLQNYNGQLVRWERSTDGFVTIESIAHTAAEYQFTDLSQTTSYRVILRNGVCEEVSSAIATVQVDQPPVGGTISGGGIHVCAGANSGSLSLTTYSGGIVRWESSIDNFATDIQPIAFTGAELSYQNLSQTTSYRAVVGNGSCEEVTSEVSTLFVDEPAVGGYIASDVTEACSGENAGTLSLLDYIGEVLRWESSLDGFASDVQPITSVEPQLSFSNITATTSYRAVVDNGACEEVYSEPLTIQVSPLSEGGMLAGSTEECADVNSGELSLSGYTGDILSWESSTDNFATITTIANTSALLSYENLSQTTAYRAVVKSGVCSQVYSPVATITVSSIAGGTLSGEQMVCAGENTGELLLSSWQGNILRWESSTDGFATLTPIAHTTEAYTFQNLTATTSFRAVVGNAVCGETYSSEVSISIQDPPLAGQLLGAATVCAGENSGSLQLESFSGNILRWEFSTDNFVGHIETISQSTPELVYENLTQTTTYRVVVGAAPCPEVYSPTATIEVEAPSAGGVLVGSKRIKAGENSGLLELQNQLGNVIQWELSTDNFDQDVQVLAHNSSSLTFQNLEVETWHRVLVQNGTCSPAYSEAARLWLNLEPVARPDTFHITAGSSFTATSSLLENDYDPDGDALLVTPGSQLSTAAGNKLSIDEEGFIYVEPEEGFVGVDSLQYRICDDAGEASYCVYSWIVLQVGEEKPLEREVLIYQGVSPNGDGLNDGWIIDYIESYPENHVQLFDRYGVLVYEMKGYNNQEKVFDGVSNTGYVAGNGSLPDATYYYRIKLNADLPVLKGYVILSR